LKSTKDLSSAIAFRTSAIVIVCFFKPHQNKTKYRSAA
jgi:hypothetical protein